MRTRMSGGVAGESGRPLPLCRLRRACSIAWCCKSSSQPDGGEVISFESTTGGVVSSARPVSRRVPPFFSNLLPEGPLRSYLAKLAEVKSEREFFLLAVLGADLPGAVVVEPSGAKHHADESE